MNWRRWGSVLCCTTAPVVSWTCADAETSNRPSARTPEVPRWVLEEDLRIDGMVEDLVPIFDMALGPNGVIGLTQPHSYSIRLYDSSGELIAAVGRRGEGPGEFQEPLLIAWVGNSFSVYDPGLQRFTLLDANGNVKGTANATSRFALDRPAKDRPPVGHAFMMRLTAEGDVLAQVLPFLGGSEDPEGRLTHVIRADTYGRVQQILARVDDQPQQIEVGSETRRASAPMPLQNLSKLELAPDGGRLILAKADLEGEAAGTYAVTSIGLDGDTLFHHRYAFEPFWISDEYADSLVEAGARSMEREHPRLARAYRRRATLPPMMPPVLSLKNGEDGTIWIRLRTRSRDREYLVLDEMGEPLGRVSLPTERPLYMADRSYVWTTERNELDVPTLVRYRIVR